MIWQTCSIKEPGAREQWRHMPGSDAVRCHFGFDVVTASGFLYFIDSSRYDVSALIAKITEEKFA